MKCILALFLFIIFLPMYGCSTPSYLVITDASNYREKLTITRSSLTFYNGEYIGSEKNCFPPIENRICEDPEGEEVYKAGKKLKMERINIKIKDTSSVNTKVVKDMAYLAAAELTEQLGYKTFTITDVVENNSCGLPMYSVNTDGHRVGDTYYGSSRLNERTICSSQFSISVLLYDDQEELKLGVLSLRTGQSRLGPKRSLLSPYKDLYSGTSPGLYEENLKRELMKTEPGKYDSSRTLTMRVPKNAWKTHYDVKGLADELRNQYGITEKIPYDLEKHQETSKVRNEQKKPDLLEKYKIAE